MSDAVAASAFWEAQYCSVQTLTLHPDRRCPPCTEKKPEIQSTLGILLSGPAPEAQHPEQHHWDGTAGTAPEAKWLKGDWGLRPTVLAEVYEDHRSTLSPGRINHSENALCGCDSATSGVQGFGHRPRVSGARPVPV
ncbi:hypothetical protein MG293_006743 [Ovis ammon polii]|uniref:Uncharacterized protein n=1 Tax=Ovis ammon polii TaxID=230172 RepID=A0AAD4UHP0_OVIAM|nr:hypothetical protein MG293_006743 [Ovis ammon polii]